MKKVLLPEYSEVKKYINGTSDTLLIVPVFNEMPHLKEVISSIRENWKGDILTVDDCSDDGSLAELSSFTDISIISNKSNAGAGGVLLQGFKWAEKNKYTNIITMDADGQHCPESISTFLRTLEICGCCCSCDFVWGSRYLNDDKKVKDAFAQRKIINREITERLNDITGYNLTDAFCGFRAYKVESLMKLPLTETGYGMFMQMTIWAAKHGMTIKEIEVPLVYLDETRDFKGNFSDFTERRQYYHNVIDEQLTLV